MSQLLIDMGRTVRFDGPPVGHGLVAREFLAMEQCVGSLAVVLAAALALTGVAALALGTGCRGQISTFDI